MVGTRASISMLCMVAICAGPGADARAQPLQPAGVLILRETPESVIGRPNGLVASPSRSFWVLDGLEKRLIEFDAGGQFVGAFGRNGSGPGEFRAINALVEDRAGRLLLADISRGMVIVIDGRTRSLEREIVLTGVVTSLSARDSLIVAGRMRHTPSERGSIAIVRGTGSVAVSAGPYPAVYDRALLLRQTLANSKAALSSSRIAITLGGVEPIYLTDRAGVVTDSLIIPRLRRRGVPRDIEQRFARARRYEDELEGQSIVEYLAWITETQLLVVHYDYYAVKDSEEFHAHGFASLVDLERRTVCADVPLELASDARVPVTSRGDQLMVLEQDADAQPGPVSRVRMWRLHFEACRAPLVR